MATGWVMNSEVCMWDGREGRSQWTGNRQIEKERSDVSSWFCSSFPHCTAQYDLQSSFSRWHILCDVLQRM
jgi:hypothetical protein